MMSEFEFASSRSFADQEDREDAVAEPLQTSGAPVGEKKRVAVLEVGEGGLPCDTVDEAYALLDEYTFESVRVAVNGPVAGTLVTSAARAAGEHSSIEAPDFVAGPAAVFVQHCELQGLPCRVDVSTPQPALSLYL